MSVALASLGIGFAARDPAWLRGVAFAIWIVSLAGQIDTAKRWQLLAVALVLFDLSFSSQLRGALSQGRANISIALVVLASGNLFLIWLSRRLIRERAASSGP